MNLISDFTNGIKGFIVGLSQPSKPKDSIYANCKFTLKNVSQDGFQLLDGSLWRVDEADLSNFKAWEPSDEVVIVATNEPEQYEVVKIDSNEKVISSIKACLYMSPLIERGFRVFGIEGDFIHINKVDPLENFPIPVTIKVSAESKEEMKRWLVSDRIVLGLQFGPDHPEYNPNELMLINCNLHSHIHVRYQPSI